MTTLVKQELSSSWSGFRLIHLNEQCAALFAEIEKVAGVQTIFVCDNHGKVVGAWSVGAFDRGLYNIIGTSLAQTFAALQARGGCKDLEYRFEQKILFARDMGNAFVVILLTPGTSLSLLRITLNVAAATFEADVDLQNSFKQVAATRAGSLTQNSMNVLMWQLAQKANLKT
jgi:hypothetical protein